MAATGTLVDNESGRMQGAITKPPLRGLITSAEAQGPGKPSDVSEHARLLSVWASFRQEHADVEVQGTQSNYSGVLQGAPDHGTATDLCGAETLAFMIGRAYPLNRRAGPSKQGTMLNDVQTCTGWEWKCALYPRITIEAEV